MSARVEKLLKLAQRHSLVFATGEGIRDTFYHPERARSLHATLLEQSKERYDFAILISRDGSLSFRSQEEERAYFEWIGTAENDGLEAVESTGGAAVVSATVSFSQVLARRSESILLILCEPEDVDFPSASFRALTDGLYDAQHHQTSAILIVKPSRVQDLQKKMEDADVTCPLRHVSEISTPDRSECRQLSQYLRTECNLYGNADVVSQEWSVRRGWLRELEIRIRGLEPRERLEQALDAADVESVDDVLADLHSMIGLDRIKEDMNQLLELLKQQADDLKLGITASLSSTHMCFLGNPGTGKTEVARIVARLLRACGLRSTGEFVEISAATDLTSRHVGEAVERLNAAINQATGGVLFIDEAYQLARGGSQLREVADALMKAMEDRRGQMTVILAGYDREMRDVWALNPGLRSRIPESNDFHFEDYKAEELVGIFEVMAQQGGIIVEPDAKGPVLDFITRELQCGRFANGRGVRNLFDASLKKRIECGSDGICHGCIPNPASYDPSEASEVLLTIVNGLPGAPQSFLNICRDQICKRAEHGELHLLPHAAILGSRGCGLSQAIPVYASLLKACGYVRRGQVIECTAAVQPELCDERFADAKSGVLHIKEAHLLADSRACAELIAQIASVIENKRFSDCVVILSGEAQGVNRLLARNNSLADVFEETRQFAFQISASDVLEKTTSYLDTYQIEEVNFRDKLRSQIERRMANPQFAGILEAENLAQAIIDRQRSRRAREDGPPFELKIEDIGSPPPVAAAIQRIRDEMNEAFVGLDDVKKEITRIGNSLRVQAVLGDGTPRPPRLVFFGNPGTGKTTFARYLHQILFTLGIVPRDLFLETRGLELKASYVGQTQEKVLETFASARGGTLFIDEVYALSPPGGKGDIFGQEAIDAIVGQSELAVNSNTCIILAGYLDETLNFLEANPGLSRRFAGQVRFPDYSTNECVEILRRRLAALPPFVGVDVLEECYKDVEAAIENRKAAKSNHFGNAGDMGNLAGRIQVLRDERLVEEFPDDPEAWKLNAAFRPEDVIQALEEWL